MAQPMDRPVNPGVTSAFIAEAMSYLPQILEALEVAGQGPANPAGLEDAYRLVHTIRGASSLVGFASISDRAAAVETALEQIVVKGGELGGDDARHLQEMVCEIGAEIDRLATDAGAGGFDDEWMDANLSDDDASLARHRRRLAAAMMRRPTSTCRSTTRCRPS